MESSLSHGNNYKNLDKVLLPMAQSVLVETLIHAQKSLLLLLLVMGPQPDGMHVVPDLLATDKRFPMAELNKLEKPAAENRDAGESDEEEDSDGDNDQEEDDGSSGEEGGEDDDDDEDSEGDAESDEGSDDDEDDDEDDEDEDDDEEDDDDDEGDEEEETQPPSKKKK